MGIAVAIGFVGMIATFLLAYMKNRHMAVWGGLGFCVPVVALIVLACLPARPEVRAA